jgi:hypothetical protein
MINNILKKIEKANEVQKVELEKHEVELGLVQDIQNRIEALKQADKLALDVFSMYDKAVNEAKSFSDRYYKIMQEITTIGSSLETKSKELGIDVPKEVNNALKMLDVSEKQLNRLYKIAKG